jgi:hypothetical protein
MKKMKNKHFKAGILLLILIIPIIVSASSQVTYVQSTEEGSLQFGDPYVYLTPIVENNKCIGAMAHGVFPYKLISRAMKVKIEYEAYDDEENYYEGTYIGNVWESAGVWFLNRGVEIEDFDHGEFWAYCYENNVLKDSDYAEYTWEDSES